MLSYFMSAVPFPWTLFPEKILEHQFANLICKTLVNQCPETFIEVFEIN